MEITTANCWAALLNCAHYFFLVALIVLIIFFVYKAIKAKSEDAKKIKSHQRSHKRSQHSDQ